MKKKLPHHVKETRHNGERKLNISNMVLPLKEQKNYNRGKNIISSTTKRSYP